MFGLKFSLKFSLFSAFLFVAGRWWSRGYFQPQNSVRNSLILLLFVWFEFQPKIQWLFLGLFLGRWAEVDSLSDGPETSGVCIVLFCSKDNCSCGSLSCGSPDIKGSKTTLDNSKSLILDRILSDSEALFTFATELKVKGLFPPLLARKDWLEF